MTNLKKIALILLVAVIILFSGMVIFSPYGSHAGFSYKLILHTVVINAPADSVYRYLGNSNNATQWSVFVDHISPLNADSVPDGKPGSWRRCFCNPDEKGAQWDELITEVVPGKKRQLVMANLQGFTMTADGLATEQLYESLSSNKCRLTFTVFYKDGSPSLWESIKTYFAAYKIKSIFEDNMNNIKRISETGR